MKQLFDPKDLQKLVQTKLEQAGFSLREKTAHLHMCRQLAQLAVADSGDAGQMARDHPVPSCDVDEEWAKAVQGLIDTFEALTLSQEALE